MAGWRPSAGPEFNRAANALQAWREREKAALDARTRELFARIREETERKKRETQRRFAQEREARVEHEKAKLLLHRPGVALKMLPAKGLRESIAYYKAADMVRRGHEHELEGLERDCERREDAFLKEQEREREARKLRTQFRSSTRERDYERDRERGDDGRSR